MRKNERRNRHASSPQNHRLIIRRSLKPVLSVAEWITLAAVAALMVIVATSIND
jgi:hypothetical protein